MAIISIFAENADKNNPTEILSLNEEHFIFDSNYTFLHFEFITYLHKNTKSIKILLHGNIVSNGSDEYKNKIKTNDLYEKYIVKFLDEKVGAVSSDIISFSKTFIYPEKYETNCHYEPPQEKIFVDKLCEKNNQKEGAELKFQLYGAYITAPNIKFKYVNNEKGCSFIEIYKENGNDFKSKTPYGFRIGLWLKSDKSTGNLLNWAMLRFKYDIHFYCLDKKIMDSCPGDWFIKKQEYSRLWTKIDPKRECGIKTIINEFKKQKGHITIDMNFDDIAGKLSCPHTDIWAVLPEKWGLVTNHDVLYRGENPRYILYMPNEEINVSLPFTHYHSKVSQIIESSYYCITSKTHYLKELKLGLTVNRITQFWKPFLRHLIVYLSLPTFLLLVHLSVKLKFNENLCKQDYILALVLYLSALCIDFLFSHKKFIIQFLLIIRNSQLIKKLIFLLDKLGIKKEYLTKACFLKVVNIVFAIVSILTTFFSNLFIGPDSLLRIGPFNIVMIFSSIAAIASVLIMADTFNRK